MKNSELAKLQELFKSKFEKGKVITRYKIIDVILKQQEKQRWFLSEIKTGEAIYVAVNMGYKVKGYNPEKLKKWSKYCSEKQMYKELRSKHSVREISKITGETENQVKAKLLKYNIKRNIKDRFNKNELKKDYETMTLKEMQTKYGVSESTIYKYLKEYNIPRKTA